ncbi:MAG: TIR domain-containing protein [Acidobacteriota bacterium]
MGKKIFVSYKHRDSCVQSLDQYGLTTARDYVDKLAQLFSNDHIYKGERGNEDLGGFRDPTIESHLRSRIFDSTITIVLISKNMKESGVSEDDQWIPWEVSYSLREKTRDGRTSGANAMLAVALPDEYGSYEYFVDQNACYNCSTTTWKTNTLFNVLGKNMFNRKQPRQGRCSSAQCGRVFNTGDDHSYIHPVRWDYFQRNINGYIDLATRINENIDDYEITKTVLSAMTASRAA